MFLLSLPSSSRWPSCETARRPEECTDKLCSGSYIPLNSLIASPVFITAIVALRVHERTAVGRHFFRDYNEDSPWGWNHWLKKTVFSAQCWPQGETFKACKAQMDSPALHVLSDSEHLQQRTCAPSYFSKGDSIFFLERPSSFWFVFFLGVSPKQQQKKHEPLWMIALEENMKKLKRNLKWPRNNQEQRRQFCVNYTDIPTFNGKVISYLLSQRSVISPTCTLFHPWVLCTICCIVIVMVLSGIDVPSDYFL